jgi:hypothetical protein
MTCQSVQPGCPPSSTAGNWVSPGSGSQDSRSDSQAGLFRSNVRYEARRLAKQNVRPEGADFSALAARRTGSHSGCVWPPLHAKRRLTSQGRHGLVVACPLSKSQHHQKHQETAASMHLHCTITHPRITTPKVCCTLMGKCGSFALPDWASKPQHNHQEGWRQAEFRDGVPGRPIRVVRPLDVLQSCYLKFGSIHSIRADFLPVLLFASGIYFLPDCLLLCSLSFILKLISECPSKDYSDLPHFR